MLSPTMRLLGVAAFAVVLALGLSKAEQDPEDKVDRGCMCECRRRRLCCVASRKSEVDVGFTSGL